MRRKEYLKWDDLDWCNPALKERYLGFKVRMGDNIYSLHYALDRFGCPCCWLVTIQGAKSMDLGEPFFSDLHLERMKE